MNEDEMTQRRQEKWARLKEGGFIRFFMQCGLPFAALLDFSIRHILGYLLSVPAQSIPIYVGCLLSLFAGMIFAACIWFANEWFGNRAGKRAQ